MWDGSSTTGACSTIRQRDIVPLIPDIQSGRCVKVLDSGGFAVDWSTQEWQHAASHREPGAPAREYRRQAGRTRGLRDSPEHSRRREAQHPRAVERDAGLLETVAMVEGRAAAWIIPPRDTYRAATRTPGFTFKDATALIPYLADLGISHVYCSPYFRARPGSVHGYDVVDHNSLNPEIGTRTRFRGFRQHPACARHGAHPRLRAQPRRHHGRRQRVVDGRARERQGVALRRVLRHRLVAAESCARGQAAGAGAGRAVRHDSGTRRAAASIRARARIAGGVLFPASVPDRSAHLSRSCSNVRVARFASPLPATRELESLVSAFRNLPDRETATPEQIIERDRDEEIHKQRLRWTCWTRLRSS